MTDNVLRRRTTCRGCGKEIAFIKTINGKSIPVDPEPVMFEPAEENEKFVTPAGEVVRGTTNSGGNPWKMEKGYISHFATCPCADEFRKKNKRDRKR